VQIAAMPDGNMLTLHAVQWVINNEPEYIDHLKMNDTI
jgi:hypothetical protein